MTPPAPPEDKPVIPPAAADYLHVRKRYYAIPFLLLFTLLTLLDVGVEKKTDAGFARLNRLNQRNSIFTLRHRPQNDTRVLVEQLELTPQDVLSGQYAIDRYLDYQDQETFIDWKRLVRVSWRDYTFFLGAELFGNALLSVMLATMLYYRKRRILAEELIGYQAKRYRLVHQQLEAKMVESTRIIEQFNKLQSKLLEAEKLASIGRLSATLAHEIRNPLSIIKSSMEIISDDVPKGSGSDAALGLIRDEVNRLDRIITDLLNFARPKAPRLECHKLRQLVRHWIPPVVEELEKHRIQLVPQLENFDVEVIVDADQLWQVFLNVMWNARDALVGVANPHVFVRIEDADQQYVKLVIQDTGHGMLPETLQQIKEPFFTTKTQGTGLGIPVSVQLIEGMGGRFEITSELEVGTTVSLYLLRASVILKNQPRPEGPEQQPDLFTADHEPSAFASS